MSWVEFAAVFVPMAVGVICVLWSQRRIEAAVESEKARAVSVYGLVIDAQRVEIKTLLAALKAQTLNELSAYQAQEEPSVFTGQHRGDADEAEISEANQWGAAVDSMGKEGVKGPIPMHLREI